MEIQEFYLELLSFLGEVRSFFIWNCIREESFIEDFEGVGIGLLGFLIKKQLNCKIFYYNFFLMFIYLGLVDLV